jgi:hypothetical protein
VGTAAGATAAFILTSGNNGLQINNGTTQIYLGTTGGVASVGSLNGSTFQIIYSGTAKLTIAGTSMVCANRVEIQDGTAGAPKFCVSTNNGAGIFKSGNGLGFSANATQALSLTSTSAVFTYPIVSGYTSALDADYTGVFGLPYVSSIGSGNSAYHFVALSNVNSGSGAAFIGAHSRGTGTDANTIIQVNDQLTVFAGYGADGAAFQPAAAITIEVDGTPGAGDMPGRIRFLTSPDGSTTLTEAMRIDNAQKVIVGSDPGGTDRLRVNGALTINDTSLIRTKTSFTNGAAAAAGTLLNAPAAGNPTKWIPVDDNGTTRYIPAW